MHFGDSYWNWVNFMFSLCHIGLEEKIWVVFQLGVVNERVDLQGANLMWDRRNLRLATFQPLYIPHVLTADFGKSFKSCEESTTGQI